MPTAQCRELRMRVTALDWIKQDEERAVDINFGLDRAGAHAISRARRCLRKGQTHAAVNNQKDSAAPLVRNGGIA